MLLLTMVNHGWQCFCQPWATMVDWGAISQTYGWPWLTMVQKSFAKPWSTMVDYGLKKALPNHGQPWLTMVDWPTMVNHGRLLSIFFCLFSSENPMAEPWPANQAGTSTSLLVENRYKVSLLTWDSFVQTGVQWLHKDKFQSLQTLHTKWVSVWSPYFCIDIFSGVRSQKLVQCESEITKRP